MPAYITGFGVCLPNDAVPNDQIEDVIGTVNDRPSQVKDMILQRNGIRWRYYAVDPKTKKATHNNAQLTAQAVRNLGETTGLSLDDMELLVCGTSSPDLMIPNHACMVLGELKSSPCEAVSTAGVCCSGITALKYAYLNVECGQVQNAVSCGSELASGSLKSSQFKAPVERDDATVEANPYLAFDQEFLRFMLSDGAGAAHISAQPRSNGLSLKIEFIDIVTFANEAETCMYAGGVRDADGTMRGWRQAEHGLEEVLKKGYLNLSQDVNVLVRHIVPMAGRSLERIRARRDLDPKSIDFFLPHLSSMFFKKPMYDVMASAGFEVPNGKWFTNLPYKGNTGAASIYIILEELLNSGRLQPGHRVLCAVPESARFTYALMLLTVVGG